MRLKAYQALSPRSDLVHEVASFPYDVVSTPEARQLVEGKPYSMLRVVRAEVGFPEPVSPYEDRVYAKAVAQFEEMQKEGILQRRPQNELFLYRQIWNDHKQRGLAGLCHVEDYEQDIIKKHEKTRKDKEDDRTRLIRETRAQHGPVFLTYRDKVEITARMDQVEANETPLFDFTADDGIRHTVWALTDIPFWVQAFDMVPVAYVADGHHRSASAVRVARELREANPNHSGEEEYNWFLSVLFPASELKILPYHRLVLDWGNSSPQQLQEQLKALGAEPTDAFIPEEKGIAAAYFDGQWWKFSLPEALNSSPADNLEASRLHEHLLSPVLGIGDPRTDERISFVGGIRGIQGLTQPVDSGEAVVAFALPAVTLDNLMDIADAGEIMPPKTTWFEPKLRTGLFMHTF